MEIGNLLFVIIHQIGEHRLSLIARNGLSFQQGEERQSGSRLVVDSETQMLDETEEKLKVDILRIGTCIQLVNCPFKEIEEPRIGKRMGERPIENLGYEEGHGLADDVGREGRGNISELPIAKLLKITVFQMNSFDVEQCQRHKHCLLGRFAGGNAIDEIGDPPAFPGVEMQDRRAVGNARRMENYGGSADLHG